MNLKQIVESLAGWCTPEKAQVLFDLVLKSDSQISLELGVFGGRSLIPMALAHQQKESGFVLGVDAWQKQASLEGDGASKEGVSAKENDDWWAKVNYSEVYQNCLKAIEKNNLNGYCGTVKMRTLSVGLLIRDNSIDILHQDSNHSEEISCAEVELFHFKVKSGGYWISDDTDWDTTQKAQELLMSKGFECIDDFDSYRVYLKQ